MVWVAVVYPCPAESVNGKTVILNRQWQASAWGAAAPFVPSIPGTQSTSITRAACSGPSGSRGEMMRTETGSR